MLGPVVILDFLIDLALVSVVTDVYVTYMFDEIYCITVAINYVTVLLSWNLELKVTN
jgi:hypothetical protein